MFLVRFPFWKCSPLCTLTNSLCYKIKIPKRDVLSPLHVCTQLEVRLSLKIFNKFCVNIEIHNCSWHDASYHPTTALEVENGPMWKWLVDVFYTQNFPTYEKGQKQSSYCHFNQYWEKNQLKVFLYEGCNLQCVFFAVGSFGPSIPSYIFCSNKIYPFVHFMLPHVYFLNNICGWWKSICQKMICHLQCLLNMWTDHIIHEIQDFHSELLLQVFSSGTHKPFCLWLIGLLESQNVHLQVVLLQLWWTGQLTSYLDFILVYRRTLGAISPFEVKIDWNFIPCLRSLPLYISWWL